MPLIFEIEQKPVYKIVEVYGVQIPVMGEFTVAETIAIEKAEIALGDNPTTTEKLRAWFAAWLALRCNADENQVLEQLNKSAALINALWEVYKGERFGIITVDDDDETVTEGKEESEPLVISNKNGTVSILNSQIADLRQNSLVVLDNSLSV